MFGIYLEGALKNISKSIMHNIVMFLLFTLVFSYVGFITVSLSCGVRLKAYVASGKLEDNALYLLMSIAPSKLQNELNGLSDAEMLAATQKLLAELCTVNGAEVITVSNETTHILDFKGDDRFLFGYEYGQPDDFCKSAVITQNTLAYIDFSVFEGRSLTADDFVFDESKPVPVLLGYDYKGVYNIGDILLEGDPDGSLFPKLSANGSMEVVGFLKKDFSMYIPLQLYTNLNNYIIIPFAYPTPEYAAGINKDSNELTAYDSLCVIYGRRFLTNGTYLYLQKDKEAEQQKEAQAVIDSNVPFNLYYKILEEPYEEVNKNTETFLNFTVTLAAVLMVFSCVSVLYGIKHTISRNIPELAVYMTVGASRADMTAMLVMQNCILLLLADIVAFIISWPLSNTLYIGYFFNGTSVAVVALFNLAVIVVTLLVALMSLPAKNLSDIIK